MSEETPDGKQARPEVNIKISDDELRGSYSNLLRIAHGSRDSYLCFLPPLSSKKSELSVLLLR